MFIASCEIRNYKSFRSSEAIVLKPGFNVVVGQNNAGKTALVEALGLHFKNNPHRSLTTEPANKSSVKMTIVLGPEEIFRALRKLGPFLVPMNYGEHGTATTTVRFYNSVNDTSRLSFEFDGSWHNPSWHGFDYDPNRPFVHIECNKSHNRFDECRSGGGVHLHTRASEIAELFKNRIYVFRAERLNVHESLVGTNQILSTDAKNLAEVLHYLQSNNPSRFARFVTDVRTVFPDIQHIAVVPMKNNNVLIKIWFVDPATEREDLAVPLADCGTGIGQILAMLYVVISSDWPRTILIDEPQSFLHPGAIQKLFEIFKRELHRKHQFIVTTHSPTVVTAASPCNVVLLRRKDNESTVETIDINETAELRLFLNEIGARLSDVFGADRILWVEGRTEEVCFHRIVDQVLKIELLGTEIIGVTHVGDLEGRHKQVVLEIYQKLCKGRGLLPPALGFCFDQEGRTDKEREELTNDSRGLIQFIPRRMYENYLLNPTAIAAILAIADTGRKAALTEQDVSEWLQKRRGSLRDDWVKTVDAAKLLQDLFNDLSETRVAFDKLKHGVKLTDWIIQNSPGDLDELAGFLKTFLRS